MSIEEKAAAFDKAFEAIKGKYEMAKREKAWGTVAWMEEVFPQLAESEDERIRKAIIKALLTDEGIGALDDADVEYEEATAWLEKQKEQKPLPGFENADEGIPGKDFIPVEWVDTCDRYGKWKIVRCDEQKPAEWSEEDEINRQIAIGKLEGTEVALEWYIEQRVINWLKSLRISVGNPAMNK